MLRITLHNGAVGNAKSASGRTAGRRAGFTLMELMIAIGILGVGMVMVTAVFPAAIKESETANNNILGTMICENGLNMAKLAYKASDYTEPTYETFRTTGRSSIDETINTDIISQSQQRYPVGETGSEYGYALLLKRCDGDNYMILCTAYRKKATGNNAKWQAASNSTTSGTTNTFTVSSGGAMRLGSPFILYKSGQYGIITNIIGNVVTLDRELSPQSDDSYVIVLQETNVSDSSPAIYTMITRTGLQP